MANSITYFVISFILLLRLSKGSLFDLIGRQHGRSTTKAALNLIADEKKKVKCTEDLSFLTSCKTFGIFPKFLRFKLYKKTLHGSKLYKNFQTQLLDNEIKEKKRRITELVSAIAEKRKSLSSTLSLFQYYWLSTDHVPEFARTTFWPYREKRSLWLPVRVTMALLWSFVVPLRSDFSLSVVPLCLAVVSLPFHCGSSVLPPGAYRSLTMGWLPLDDTHPVLLTSNTFSRDLASCRVLLNSWCDGHFLIDLEKFDLSWRNMAVSPRTRRMSDWFAFLTVLLWL